MLLVAHCGPFESNIMLFVPHPFCTLICHRLCFSTHTAVFVRLVNNATHVLENINIIMDKLEAIETARFIDADGKTLPLKDYGIEMQQVNLAYGERTVLRDVSFTVPQNTTTAIVGPSGGGKTTLYNLMARFYDANSGTVRVGGVDVKELTCDCLLKNISMVFQNVYLFHDTVLNNIRFGRPGATSSSWRCPRATTP